MTTVQPAPEQVPSDAVPIGRAAAPGAVVSDPLPAAPIRRAAAGFLFSHPAHFIALGFGCGLSPFAPGTVGTLWAWLAFVALDFALAPTDWQWGALIGLATLVGWWASTVTARHMRVLDPGQVVIDEIVAFWLVLWLVMPAGLWGQLTGFVIFRVLDMVKPGPIAWADEVFARYGWRYGGWPNGWGIIFDDLAAAFGTLLIIALWRFWA